MGNLELRIGDAWWTLQFQNVIYHVSSVMYQIEFQLGRCIYLWMYLQLHAESFTYDRGILFCWEVFS